MWVRLIYAIISALLLCGCVSPLEKSVIEPLNAKEIDKVVGKDKSFLTTYSIVEEKWNYISTPGDSVRWQEITYGRLHSYLNTIGSNELNAPLFNKLRQKWEDQNNRNNKAADALVEKWREYLSANSPDSLATVSFSGLELEKIRNSKKEIDTLLRAAIKIRTLKGKIDSISFLYSFSDTISNPISHRKVVKDSAIIKVFPNMDSQIRKRLVEGDTSVRFIYTLKSVYSEGKCYNLDSLKQEVPEPVLALIEGGDPAKSPIFNGNIYKERIIREEIDPTFISQSAYIKINAENYYRQLDSLVYSYINYSGAR